MTVLEIIIAEKHYAIDTDEVLEYTPYAQPEPVEGPSPYIEGTAKHLGCSYTIVNMRRYMRAEPVSDGFLVYLKQKNPPAALHVDNVTGVYMEMPKELTLISAAAIVSEAFSGETGQDKAEKLECENAAKAEEEKKRRDKQTSIHVENKELEAALADYNQAHSVESLNVLVNMILGCRLLLPAAAGAAQRPVPMLLRSKKGESFIPVYTCRERIDLKPEPKAILNLSYEALNRMALDKSIGASGLVINSGHENVLFKRELLEQIDVAYARHEAAVKQQREAQKAGSPVPIDPSQDPGRLVDNSALEDGISLHSGDLSSEDLENIAGLLKDAHLFVPGMLDDKKQPKLSLLKNKGGQQFIPAFTSKQKLPSEPRIPAVFCIPFEDLRRNALAQKDRLTGIMLNPGDKPVIIPIRLLVTMA